MAKKSTKLARVLVDINLDGVCYKPNVLLEAESSVIQSLVVPGYADDSQAAIDYLKSEGVSVTLHSPEDVAPDEGFEEAK